MNVLVMARSPLYNAISPLFSRQKHLLLLSSSSSPYISQPIFSLSKHLLHQIHNNKVNPMAACVDTCIANNSQISHDHQTNRSKRDDHSHACKYVTFCRPASLSDHVSCIPFGKNQSRASHGSPVFDDNVRGKEGKEDLWLKMQEEARLDVEQEPILSSYYYTSILSQKSLESALANHLAVKLSNSTLPGSTLFDVLMGVLKEDQEIIRAVVEDLKAVKDRDPACISYVHCFLNFKGFLAIQTHRIAHKLWTQGRNVLAVLLQNRVSEVFAVDIHPGAKIGHGILLDHATGVVVGETAVIGNNVSILHSVTLGGTGKVGGDRHPKIGDGVLIGAGTCILGNIRIGDGAKIGAGSVVLKEVPDRTTAVGNPAKLVGGKGKPAKLDKIPSFTMDHTSHVSEEFYDYVI